MDGGQPTGAEALLMVNGDVTQARALRGGGCCFRGGRGAAMVSARWPWAWRAGSSSGGPAPATDAVRRQTRPDQTDVRRRIPDVRRTDVRGRMQDAQRQAMRETVGRRSWSRARWVHPVPSRTRS